MGIFLLYEDAFALISLIHAIVVRLLSITMTQYIENNMSFNLIDYGAFRDGQPAHYRDEHAQCFGSIASDAVRLVAHKYRYYYFCINALIIGQCSIN